MPDLPPVHNPRKTKRRTQVRQAAARQAKRLYATYDPVWRRLRNIQLRNEPLCRECHKHGRITAGTTVDHIDTDTFNNGRDNLQTLCKKCHDSKTGKESGFGSPARSS